MWTVVRTITGDETSNAQKAEHPQKDGRRRVGVHAGKYIAKSEVRLSLEKGEECESRKTR